MITDIAGNKKRRDFKQLRQKAKKIMSRLESDWHQKDIADSKQMLEELNVYHIELELQHEEIQNTRDKLEQSEKYLETLFKHAPLGYVVLDTDGKIQDINDKASTYFQFDPKVFIGQRLQAFIPHETLFEYNKCMNHVMQNSIPSNCEVVFRAQGGHSFWARVDLFLIRHPKIRTKMILCSIMDISTEKQVKQELIGLNRNLETLVSERTQSLKSANEKLLKEIKERKKAEQKSIEYAEKQENLTHEINHRVKNNMQIMIALMKLQAKKTSNPDVVEAVTENQNRIKALAVIHDALSLTNDVAAISFNRYLNKLVKNIAVGYGWKPVRIKIDSKISELHIDQALPIGIVLTELITNAIKYAYPEKSEGDIYISAKPLKNNGVQITVRDKGIGVPEKIESMETNSLGLHLVKRLITGQLRGTVEINQQEGTEVIVSFPIK